MIRRDYFIKLVQELSGVLMRVFSLKARREFAVALQEIDSALGVGRQEYGLLSIWWD